MKKVFIIEDDKTMQDLIKTLLEMEGFLVLFPEKILKDVILKSIQESHPDILFMDVMLRQVSGIDLLKHIKADPQFNGLKIIMSSGLGLEYECLQAGANAFLQKPYMPDQLVALLKSNG